MFENFQEAEFLKALGDFLNSRDALIEPVMVGTYPECRFEHRIFAPGVNLELEQALQRIVWKNRAPVSARDV